MNKASEFALRHLLDAAAVTKLLRHSQLGL
jgi:hypothetical protein